MVLLDFHFSQELRLKVDPQKSVTRKKRLELLINGIES